MKSLAEITEEGVQIFAFELVRFLSNFKAFSGPCYPHFGSFLRVWSGIGRKLEQGGGRRCVLASFWSQLCRQNVPRGSQDASKLAILAPKCDQDGQLGGPNEAFEGLQGHFSGSWTRSYEKIDKLKKRTTVQRFRRILACWRVCSDPLGAIVCSS